MPLQTNLIERCTVSRRVSLLRRAAEVKHSCCTDLFFRGGISSILLHGRFHYWIYVYASSRKFCWRTIHHAIPTAAFRSDKWHSAPSPECPDCHAPREDLPLHIFHCPVKRDAWTQILYEYTSKVGWPDQELENPLKPSCPAFRPSSKNDIWSKPTVP